MSFAAVLLSALAILAGTLFPMQTAINARLAAGVGGPIVATAISFLAGLAALIVLVGVTTRSLPDWDRVSQLPWWIFVVGGLLGATYLSLNVYLVPRIGSGAMMALAIAGQVLAALIIDTRGFFGIAAREISIGRMGGAALVVIGAIMVRFL